jgi:hypothetical protein
MKARNEKPLYMALQGDSIDMTSHGKERELLTEFERENLPDPFRAYYSVKRQNLLANIQGFKVLFDAFMLLDKILAREFEDMMPSAQPTRMFPVLVFVNAHAKMRVAFELAFSSCIPEAHSIVRDAIESVAHGHRLLSEPELIRVWLQNGEDEAATTAFKEAFWHDKEQRLFSGLDELYRLWKQFSEFGSHTNVRSITHRFVVEETPKHVGWRMNYTGLKPETLLPVLFEMLLVFFVMEEVFYKDCSDRLKLDIELNDMRKRFNRDKEDLRAKIRKLIGRARSHPNTATDT